MRTQVDEDWLSWHNPIRLLECVLLFSTNQGWKYLIPQVSCDAYTYFDVHQFAILIASSVISISDNHQHNISWFAVYDKPTHECIGFTDLVGFTKSQESSDYLKSPFLSSTGRIFKTTKPVVECWAGIGQAQQICPESERICLIVRRKEAVIEWNSVLLPNSSYSLISCQNHSFEFSVYFSSARTFFNCYIGWNEFLSLC